MSQLQPDAPFTNLPSRGADTTSLEIPFLDYNEIYRKQVTIQKLIERNKLRESEALKDEVDMDIQAHGQMLFAEKNRRLKIAIIIQEDATGLFRCGVPNSETLSKFGGVFARAINYETRLDGVGWDLLLPKPRLEKLIKKIRASARVLEAVYIECTQSLDRNQAEECARYYDAFSYPACLKHPVFSIEEVERFGLRIYSYGNNFQKQKLADDSDVSWKEEASNKETDQN
ncbi:hypothetical protein H072_4472 [Dactylellina haptotyla CBS 200.50]|uniref:Uncharacterized protein n=1 Tax=Dactylellina haptotyla (strain CBS 200.50) TaxID=1284197 RepID=S8AKG1_DACHA|nr:hypothetical protein H072_4472 [Dactylellina haptotyla CBS 200.50]